MAERLTAHARTIVNLARRQAAQLGARAVRSEHVLLAMLAADEPGVGQMVLRNLGIEVEPLRAEILRQVAPPPDKASPPAADNGALPVHTIDVGREVDQVIARARHEAAALGCRFVGTEHLLLGVLRLGEGAAFEALRAFDLTTEPVRQEAIRLLGLDGEPETAPGQDAGAPRPARHESARTPTPEARRPSGKPAASDTRAASRTASDGAEAGEPPNFQASLCRQVEGLLSQLALWSKNPEILKQFTRLNEILADATDTALDELGGLDLPEALVEPVLEIFRLNQEKVEAVALGEYRRAEQLHEAIDRVIAAQANMPPEQCRLADELIDCERQKQKAVREERYEHAARCRDRSRLLRVRWNKLVSRASRDTRHATRDFP